MQLQIGLLGPFKVLIDGVEVTQFESIKVRALLAYLAAEAGRPKSRASLAGLLWPDWPEESANKNLRQALYTLRKTIQDIQSSSPFIQADRSLVSFDPDQDCEIDTLELERCLTQATANPTSKDSIEKLELAVSQVNGEFLEGFLLDDSPVFEEWILNRREYYNRQLLKAYNILCHWYEENEAYEQAERHARRQLELEPLQETASQQLMRLLAKQGKRTEALQEYEYLKHELKESLDVSPSQATNLLYEKIKKGEFEHLLVDSTTLPAPVYEKKPLHNLPSELTSFIGRKKEIGEVVALLDKNRLVTLTGVGGTGKTRLSLQVAGLVLENYPNGVWQVELAGLSDPVMVPRTVASVLNLPDIAGKPTSESLVDFLREKRLLLILDNCEHLLEACTDLANHLLRSCPELTILATSRELLGVLGEVPYRLPPMALPDPGERMVLAQLSEYDAVHLFTERAQVVAPDFAMTEENAPVVVQVVERLDGIPLAIELAAARLRLLSVAQVAQRLDDTFRLLTGGGRGALPRHQTLRASIDWSYNLLSELERTLLRRLSVFSGSWRMRAAEQVCSDPPGPAAHIHPDEVLDLVTGLLDKSLIQTFRGADGMNRFRMLETVRQYAHEKLVDEGELEAVCDRHLAYFQEWVEKTALKIRGPEQVQTLNQLERELDNLRKALDWALRTDVGAGLKMTADLLWFWDNRTHQVEGINWLKRGVELVEMDQDPIELIRVEIDPLVYARALAVLGRFRWFQLFSISSQVDYAPEQGKSLLEKAVFIYQALNPEQNQEAKLGLALANVWLGYFLLEDERERALAMAEDSMGIFRVAGDLIGMSECLRLMADRSHLPDDSLIQEQLAIYEKMGDPTSIADIHQVIGLRAARRGDYTSASELLKVFSEHAQRANNPISGHYASLRIGSNLLCLGDLEGAEKFIKRALDGFRDFGIEIMMIWSLDGQFSVQIAQGHYDRASDVIDRAWEIAQRSEISSFVAFTLILRARLARLQGDTTLALNYLNSLPPIMDIPYYQKISIPLVWGELALQTGDLEQAGRRYLEALTLIHTSYQMFLPPFFDGVALYAARKGEIKVAACLFGSRWCRAYAHFLSPVEKEWRAEDWAAMQAELGNERFEQLYEDGKSITYEQAVDLAQEVLRE